MDLFEAIETRYSYRGAFEDSPVPRVDLKRILQAGIQAPSGMNAQSTEFIAVDDPVLLEKIALLVKNKSMQNCPAAIAVVCDESTLSNGLTFFREDYGAAVENLLLAITALGYAGVWIDGGLKRDGIAEKVSRLLNIPGSRSLQVLIPLGKASNPGTQKEKKPFHERAWFNSYPRI